MIPMQLPNFGLNDRIVHYILRLADVLLIVVITSQGTILASSVLPADIPPPDFLIA